MEREIGRLLPDEMPHRPEVHVGVANHIVAEQFDSFLGRHLAALGVGIALAVILGRVGVAGACRQIRSEYLLEYVLAHLPALDELVGDQTFLFTAVLF